MFTSESIEAPTAWYQVFKEQCLKCSGLEEWIQYGYFLLLGYIGLMMLSD